MGTSAGDARPRVRRITSDCFRQSPSWLVVLGMERCGSCHKTSLHFLTKTSEVEQCHRQDRTALSLLRKLTDDAGAVFRPHQLEAIQALVRDRRRVLLVQRTGWGKSAVYFIATRLLRDEGAGPTMLVSPLLALMRNQIEAAERMGIRAATINSANRDEWDQVEEGVKSGRSRSPSHLAGTACQPKVPLGGATGGRAAQRSPGGG